MSHREEASGEDPGHAGETMSVRLAWERLGVPPEELEEVSRAQNTHCEQAADSSYIQDSSFTLKQLFPPAFCSIKD
ncbi:hypothetical protein L3Q82_005767 [Scortum barcoo]|uniref:Uncharacterized protein n=1 Tax=Scortum barcoo TaxID=214431 RepID=A0ACB8V6K9_9TELE|nr:hypothetical protein L3Q82_005767 [Scortum barcoo]